jgi:hypothetical protein
MANPEKEILMVEVLWMIFGKGFASFLKRKLAYLRY